MDTVLGAVACPLCGKEGVLKLERKEITGFVLLDELLGKDIKQRCWQADAACPSCGARMLAALTVTAVKEEPSR
jgi:DNA-directed RNA polymerase subunit RPC12/RpoP